MWTHGLDLSTLERHEDAIKALRKGFLLTGSSARALEQLALSHGSVLSPTAIAQMADVKKSTVVDCLERLESMSLVARLAVFTARPPRRALAAQPTFYFADTCIAMALRSTDAARIGPAPWGRRAKGSSTSISWRGAAPCATLASRHGARAPASKWISS